MHSNPVSRVRPRRVFHPSVGIGVVAGALALGSPLVAQSVVVGNESARDILELEALIIEEDRAQQSTLPTRPTGAVFGLDLPVRDIPRSITQVTPLQFETDLIGDNNDFGRYSPSVNVNVSQGISGAPFIRAAFSDVFQNGIRTMVRQQNRPFQGNAYEGADIVAGPASVIFGPSARTSGYVNFLTKKPFFDRNRTQINLVAGKWYGDGRGWRDGYTWQIDNGGPIVRDRLGYRFSYQQQDSETYYRNNDRKFKDYYGALYWFPTSKLSVDWNFQYGDSDFHLLNGWNRVTDELLKDGTYLAGRATPILRVGSGASAVYYSPTNTFDGQNFVRRVNGGANRYVVQEVDGAPVAYPPPASGGTIVGWVLDPANTTRVKLEPYQVLDYAGPGANTRVFNTQLRFKYRLSDNASLLSNTYYQTYKNDSNALGSFYNWLDDRTFESRVELQLKKRFSLGSLRVEHQANHGFSYRFQDVENYKDTIPAGSVGGSAFDLTQDPSTFTRDALLGVSTRPVTWADRVRVSPHFGPIVLNPLLPNPNDPDGYASPGGGTGGGLGSSTNQTWVDQIGVFSQNRFQFGEKWAWDIGARVTHVSAKIASPLVDSTWPASVAADVVARRREWIPNGSTSVSYKPADWATTYATYSYVETVNGMTTGSPTWAAGNTLAKSNFHSLSELYEVGTKFDVIPGKLFASLAVYRQTRDLSLVNEELAKGLYRGVEASFSYQASRQFTLGGNYAFTKGNLLNNNIGATSPSGVVADNATVFQDGNTLNAYPPSDYRISGLPRHSFSVYGSYQWLSGFGVRADVRGRSSWLYNTGGVVVVPSSYTANVSVFYTQERWTTTIDFLNVTNQRTFGPSEANDTIIPGEPFAIQTRLSLRF